MATIYLWFYYIYEIYCCLQQINTRDSLFNKRILDKQVGAFPWQLTNIGYKQPRKMFAIYDSGKKDRKKMLALHDPIKTFLCLLE